MATNEINPLANIKTDCMSSESDCSIPLEVVLEIVILERQKN